VPVASRVSARVGGPPSDGWLPGRPDDARVWVGAAGGSDVDAASGVRVRAWPSATIRVAQRVREGSDFGREPARERPRKRGPTSGNPRWWWYRIKSPSKRTRQGDADSSQLWHRGFTVGSLHAYGRPRYYKCSRTQAYRKLHAASTFTASSFVYNCCTARTSIPCKDGQISCQSGLFDEGAVFGGLTAACSSARSPTRWETTVDGRGPRRHGRVRLETQARGVLQSWRLDAMEQLGQDRARDNVVLVVHRGTSSLRKFLIHTLSLS
jgi:hypothetical protein